MGKCDYPMGKKDISLRATAQIPQEILARELISIYKVKFVAKNLGLKSNGAPFLRSSAHGFAANKVA